MAAGLGFKDFVTGEVLTAADVDGYLMQGIWVFDDAAARDAAVTSPQEGNACYLKDTNEVLTYSGSVWVAVGGGAGGGKVLQVVEGTTSTAANSSSASYADTNLTATITPSAATSKVLVIVTQGGCGKSAANIYMNLRLMRGATQISINQNFYTGTSIEQKNTISMLKLDSPSTTSATTYKTQFNSITGAGTISVNGDSDSSIVLMEIGV
jgi:hypothetical protein